MNTTTPRQAKLRVLGNNAAHTTNQAIMLAPVASAAFLSIALSVSGSIDIGPNGTLFQSSAGGLSARNRRALVVRQHIEAVGSREVQDFSGQRSRSNESCPHVCLKLENDTAGSDSELVGRDYLGTAMCHRKTPIRSVQFGLKELGEALHVFLVSGRIT